jgi:hypothetical protein
LGSDVCGLPSQETYLDSQNIHSDAAKIGIISESSKFLSLFSKKAGKIDPLLKSFCIFAPTNIYNYGSNSIE